MRQGVFKHDRAGLERGRSRSTLYQVGYRAGISTMETAGLVLSKKDCPTPSASVTMRQQQHWYRSTIASCIYISSWTRPDISYTVSKLCKFMHNPGEKHFTALKRLLRYLKGTADKGLVYDFSGTDSSSGSKPKCHGLYDASHADCPDTMRSTLAYVYFIYKCVISWHTKLHSVITTSTNHSEYCAAAKAAREAKWLEKVLTELQFSQFVRPIALFSDSKGAIAMTYNPVNRSASKHIDLADHYAREQQEAGVITVTHLSTQEMIADILTKALGRPAYAYHASKLVATIGE